MPMTEITVSPFTLAAADDNALAAANADGSWFDCPHISRTFIWAINGSAGDLTVTIEAQKTTSDGATTDMVFTIPAATDIKMFTIDSHCIDTADKVYLTYAAGVGTLSIGVFQAGS